MILYQIGPLMSEVARVARKLRAALQSLAAAVDVYTRRLEVSELFELCASTTASKIGMLCVLWCVCVKCKYNSVYALCV